MKRDKNCKILRVENEPMLMEKIAIIGGLDKREKAGPEGRFDGEAADTDADRVLFQTAGRLPGREE